MTRHPCRGTSNLVEWAATATSTVTHLGSGTAAEVSPRCVVQRTSSGAVSRTRRTPQTMERSPGARLLDLVTFGSLHRAHRRVGLADHGRLDDRNRADRVIRSFHWPRKVALPNAARSGILARTVLDRIFKSKLKAQLGSLPLRHELMEWRVAYKPGRRRWRALPSRGQWFAQHAHMIAQTPARCW
jgi:hypothetical protein